MWPAEKLYVNPDCGFGRSPRGMATNLDPRCTNGFFHIYVHDRVGRTTTCVSLGSDGTQANFESSHPAISADGRAVAFISGATNLVPGDTNGLDDIFVRDRLTGMTTRVAKEGVGPVISADGRSVAFNSAAALAGCVGFNPVLPGIPLVHAFVSDRATGATRCVSVAPDGTQANRNSGPTAISADGKIVVLTSSATNLVPDSTPLPFDYYVLVARLDVEEDLPVARRYDGDARADVAVFRRSTGGWFVLRSTDNGTTTQSWGSAALGDLQAPADYDGDGRADVAVYRTSTGQWFILSTCGGASSLTFP